MRLYRALIVFLMTVVIASTAAAQQISNDLFISQPTNGSVLRPGETFQIVVNQRSGLERFYFDRAMIVLATRNVSISSLRSADPYVFQGTIPINAVGTYTLTAMGAREGGQPVMSKSVTITVPNPTFASLRSVVKSIFIKYPGAVGPAFSVVGVPPSGEEISLSNNVLSYSSSDSSVVSIVGGLPVGRKAGSASILIGYGSLTTAVTVTVGALRKIGDFDDSGSIDINDINILRSGVGSSSVGSEDARDLNRDGKIDALDIRVLTNLCTRPRCATQ